MTEGSLVDHLLTLRRRDAQLILRLRLWNALLLLLAAAAACLAVVVA